MTHADPYEMLSAEEMTILKEHYHLVKDCRGQDEVERVLKGWSARQRMFVAKLRDRLFDSGWKIDGMYPSGSLRFAQRIPSKTDQVLALSDEDFARYQRGELVFVDGILCAAPAPVGC